jgi:hypothetical protein
MRECKNCGKEYETIPSRRVVFCSVPCQKRVGQTYVSGAGYLMKQTLSGRMYEHRRVMEEYLGRPLLRREVVHHINMNKQDNRLENLFLCSSSGHAVLHKKMESLVAELYQREIVRFRNGEYEVAT